MDWISVKDRLPEERQIVLVFGRNGNPNNRGLDLAWLIDREWTCWFTSKITHWQQLPAPPEAKGDVEQMNNGKKAYTIFQSGYGRGYSTYSANEIAYDILADAFMNGEGEDPPEEDVDIFAKKLEAMTIGATYKHNDIWSVKCEILNLDGLPEWDGW